MIKTLLNEKKVLLGITVAMVLIFMFVKFINSNSPEYQCIDNVVYRTTSAGFLLETNHKRCVEEELNDFR